jgi:OPT family small oligopeptide transporter
VFYNQTYNFSYQWLLVMSTQLIGFSIGGIARRFLVQPPSMIWPANLVTCTLFNTLHSTQYSGIGDRGGLSRERFFTYFLAGAFVWWIIPGYLFTALSTFNWVCWIAPENVVVNQVFGQVSGLGGSILTFDWFQITYVGSPLAWPWWAQANVVASMVMFYCKSFLHSNFCILTPSSGCITPILYYTNTWYSKFLPMSSSKSWDNTGKKYQVLRIVDENSNFNEEKYKAYSPLFLSTTFAISYGLSFASITATLTHTLIYYRKQIWTQARRSINEQADIHARLMARYPQVPEWWYAIIFCKCSPLVKCFPVVHLYCIPRTVSMFVFGIIVIEVWPTEMPVWAFVLSLIISFVYVIPIGMIQAITNNQVGLNVITELIIGYALPGRPIAMMMFKTWGYITMAQALTFSSDFKLGHYMKIP